MNKKKLGIVGLVIAVATTAALTGGSLALAQSATATPQVETATPTEGICGPHGAIGRGWGHGLGSTTEREAIANLLGMSTDELATQLRAGQTLADLADAAGVDLQALYAAATQASETAWTAAIGQAVTDGDMTRAKADWLIEGQTQGYSEMDFGRGLGVSRSTEERDAIAEALGLTPEQYGVQIWGGRTLADLADRAGVTLEDVQTAAKTAREATLRTRIADAVANGDITQAQADWLIEGLDNGYMGDGESLGRGFGGRGDMGMGGRGHGDKGMMGAFGGFGGRGR